MPYYVSNGPVYIDDVFYRAGAIFFTNQSPIPMWRTPTTAEFAQQALTVPSPYGAVLSPQELPDALADLGIIPSGSNWMIGAYYGAKFLGLKGVQVGEVPVDNSQRFLDLGKNLEPGILLDLEKGVYGIEPSAFIRSNPMNIIGRGERNSIVRVLTNASLPNDTFGNQQQAASAFVFTRDNNTDPDAINAFGYVRGLHLENFSIEGADDRSVMAAGIMLDHFDEITCNKVIQKKLPYGGFTLGNVRAPRECAFYNCYDWWNGTSATAGPGATLAKNGDGTPDLASYRALVGWPALSMVTPGPSTGVSQGDAQNEIRRYSCKIVYSYGIAILGDSLAANANAGNTGVGPYICEFYGEQVEGMGFTLPNPERNGQSSQTLNPADQIWLRNVRQVTFHGGELACGFSGGYTAGSAGPPVVAPRAGYATLRLGDPTNNALADQVSVLGSYISGTSVSIVAGQCKALLVDNNTFSRSLSGLGIPQIVIGKFDPADAAATVVTVSNPSYQIGLNQNLPASGIVDPGNVLGSSFQGWEDVGKFRVQTKITTRKYVDNGVGTGDDGISKFQSSARVNFTGVVDNTLKRVTATDGGTITITDNQTRILINNTEQLALVNIQLPTAPIDRQTLDVWNFGPIVSLTYSVAAGSGQAVGTQYAKRGNKANGHSTLYYESTSKVWRLLPDKPAPLPTTTTGNYTLLALDDDGIVESNSSGTPIITLPNNLPVGFTTSIIQLGAGQATLTPATGATMVNRQGFTKTAGQYAVARVYVDSNADGASARYILSGDVSA